MGKHARIAELEADVAYWRRRAELQNEVVAYLTTLAEMPDDAVLTYQVTGQRVSHQIGRSAKVLLQRIAP